MNSQLTGSKSARKELEKFHSLLNNDAMIPAQCYRMSHTHYSMVCYTNQVVALYLSKNYQMIPLFIERSYKQMERFEGQPNTEGYRSLVLNYFSQMAFYLKEYTDLDPEWFKARIPQPIVDAGPKLAPEYDHQTMQIRM